MFGLEAFASTAPVLRVLLPLGLVGLATVGWADERLQPPPLAGLSVPYSPCPKPGEACRVLPLGDSLTWGIGYDGGYRVALFERARADSKRITFTGSQQNGPLLAQGQAFPRNHEGRSGWTIAQIASTIPRPALDPLPNIVLLHAGTNDVYAHATTAAMADELETLLDRLERAAPQALIAVAEILPLTDPALRAVADSYNHELVRRIAMRQARGEHLILVDQSDGFATELLSDGVHPTRAGYERMANVWYSAIGPYLR